MRPQLLVVDDAPQSRSLLGRALARRGIDIVEAGDGEAALRLIETTPLDGALLDISMPGLNGLDVLKRIRARHAPARLPVIMVSGRTDNDDIMVAFRLGANDYVTKPINVPVLVARVLTQLRRKTAEERLEQALVDLARLNFELREETRRRAQSEARAWDLAHHDPLTGLRNRLSFWENLAAALARAGESPSVALLCLDLDGFKEVNDTLGHQIGDELLRAVADRLRGVATDVASVTRLGGDEFAIVLPTKRGPEEARKLAAQLIGVISMPFFIEGHEVTIGCSVGIAFGPGAHPDPLTMLRNADAALYMAKSSGRGTWHVANDSP